MSETVLRLKPGREAPVKRRHPWLFTGGVARREGPQVAGPFVAYAADGALLGRGFLSPESPLLGRFWAYGEARVDAALVEARLDSALALRARVVPPATTGYRVVHAEGDGLPGLVVDRYGGVLVVQATTAGTEAARPLWLPALAARFPGATLVARNDLSSREGEGLSTAPEVLAGPDLPAPESAEFEERGLKFAAEILSGQKTGFFLDQRENRFLVKEISGSARVLNLFAYSGAFGVAALAGGAKHVVQVDVSAPALEAARANHERNGQRVSGDAPEASLVKADVFEDLRTRVAAGETYDVVVTDPPAFAKKHGDVDRACRGYKDVNRLAMKLLAPGGTLLACSCSGPISADLFQKILFGASIDAGVPLRLLSRHGAGPDHPVSLDCPEGEYLKAFRLTRA
ncbi:MAG: class I SAM-dependent rRNA methyltransferase [Acidobacteria bacterium]|nr:class I SAM-dependent rRNA methyltransferase [Acidobacteriota bacterium]